MKNILENIEKKDIEFKTQSNVIALNHRMLIWL